MHSFWDYYFSKRGVVATIRDLGILTKSEGSSWKFVVRYVEAPDLVEKSKIFQLTVKTTHSMGYGTAVIF